MSPKFVHKLIEVPKLERFHVDGKRFYKKVDSDEPMSFISITTITSNYSKEKFALWRKKIGEDEANRITKNATNRGTHMHNLIEHYLYNEELPKSAPLPKLLFDVAKPELNKINNILGIEIQLYSEYFEVAGTADLIAEYDGVLSIIDYKTSSRPKPREWIESYFVQAVAYSAMLYEMTGIMAKQLVIIMACENGEVEVYIETDIKKYLKLLVKYIKKFKEDHAIN
jgi:CRISPR/Cas system-associated exonuclease Cas4 (RecB family)